MSWEDTFKQVYGINPPNRKKDEDEEKTPSQIATEQNKQTSQSTPDWRDRYKEVYGKEVDPRYAKQEEKPIKEDIQPLAQQPVKQEPVQEVVQKPKNKIYSAINNAISFATGKMREWGFVGESRGTVDKEKEKSLQQKDFEMTTGFSGENIPVIRNEMLKINARNHIEYLDKILKEVEELKQDNTLYLSKKRREFKEKGEEFNARELLEYKQNRLKEIALEMGYFSKEGLKAEDIKDLTFTDNQAEGLLSFIKEDKYLAQQNILLNDEVLRKVPVDKNVWNQVEKALKSKTYLPSLLKGREAEFQEDYLLAMDAIAQGASIDQLTPNQRSAIIRQTNKDWEAMIDRGLIAEAPQGLSDMVGYMIDLAIAMSLSGGNPFVAGAVGQVTSLPKTVQRVRSNIEDQFQFVPIEDKDGFRIMTTKLGTQDDVKGAVSALAGGYIETTIELLLGRGIDKLLSVGGGALARSGAGKKILESPIAKKLGESFIVKSVSKVDNFLKKSPTAKFILQSTGLDSIAGEVAEELVQDMTNSITSGDEYEISTDYIADVASHTALLTFIAGGVTRLGGAMTDAQVQAFVNEVNSNKQAYGLPEEAELTSDGNIINTVTGEDITSGVLDGSQIVDKEGAFDELEDVAQEEQVGEEDGTKINEWQKIEDLDAEIRTIVEPKNEGDLWEVEVGVLESLGESGGNVLTETFKTKPTLEEIRQLVLEHYKNEKARINEEVATGITAKSNRDEMIEPVIDRVLQSYKGPTVKQEAQPVAKETLVKIEEKRADEFTREDREQIIKTLDSKKIKYDSQAPTHMLNGIAVASTLSNAQIREMAKDVMRDYVLRGDSLESFTQQGSTLPAWSGQFSIGGYVDGKSVGNNTVVMEMADGRVIRFDKKELYEEIKEESKKSKPPKTQKEVVKEEKKKETKKEQESKEEKKESKTKKEKAEEPRIAKASKEVDSFSSMIEELEENREGKYDFKTLDEMERWVLKFNSNTSNIKKEKELIKKAYEWLDSGVIKVENTKGTRPDYITVAKASKEVKVEVKQEVSTDKMAMLENKAQAEFEKSWDKLTPQQQYKVLMSMEEGQRYIKTTDQKTLVKLGRGVGTITLSDMGLNAGQLLWGRGRNGMYTDGVILITDKAVANKVVDKFKEQYIKEYAKQSGISVQEAQKQIVENNKDKDFPATRDILDSVKANHKLTPIGFYADKTYRQNGSIIFRADNGALVRLSGKYYSAIKSFYPSAEFYITDESNEKPISFVVGKSRKGVVMPMMLPSNSTFTNLVGKESADIAKEMQKIAEEKRAEEYKIKKAKELKEEEVKDYIGVGIQDYIYDSKKLEQIPTHKGKIGYFGEGTYEYNKQTGQVVATLADGRRFKYTLSDIYDRTIESIAKSRVDGRTWMEETFGEEEFKRIFPNGIPKKEIAEDDDVAFYTTARRRGERGYDQIKSMADIRRNLDILRKDRQNTGKKEYYHSTSGVRLGSIIDSKVLKSNSRGKISFADNLDYSTRYGDVVFVTSQINPIKERESTSRYGTEYVQSGEVSLSKIDRILLKVNEQEGLNTRIMIDLKMSKTAGEIAYDLRDMGFEVGFVVNGKEVGESYFTISDDQLMMTDSNTPYMYKWNPKDEESDFVYHGTSEIIRGDWKFPLYLSFNKEYADTYQRLGASSLGKIKLGGGEKTYTFKKAPKERILDTRNPKHLSLLEKYFNEESVSGAFYPSDRGLPDWTEAEGIAEFVEKNNLPFDALLIDEGGIPDPYSGGVIDRGIGYVALNRNGILQPEVDPLMAKKEAQLQIILDSNPMLDDYHTGIRTVNDILTFEEAFSDKDNLVTSPDWEESQMEEAIETREVEIFSSHKIQNGTFVTPSRMVAETYAGGGRVYSKIVNIEDVAWIDSCEGQYAKVSPEVLRAKEDESKGSQSLETYEAREITPAEQLKMSDEVKNLVHKYADKVGEKYLPRGVLGVFYGKTKEIRLKGITDLYVASHEISHAIDKKFDITAKITAGDGVDMQLREAYINLYPSAKETHAVKKQRQEGFAMAVATYLQRPSSFAQEYPVIVKEMFTQGGKYYNREIGEYLNDVNNIVSRYQSLNDLDRVATRISKDIPVVEQTLFKSKTEATVNMLQNDLNLFERWAEENGDTMTKADFTNLFRFRTQVKYIYENNIATNLSKKNVEEGKFKNFMGGLYSYLRKSVAQDVYMAYNPETKNIEKKYDFNWGTLRREIAQKGMDRQFNALLVARRAYYDFEYADKLRQDIETIKTELERLQDEVIEMYQKKGDERNRREERAKEAEIEGTKVILREAEEKLAEVESLLKNDGWDRRLVTDAYMNNRGLFEKELDMFDKLVSEDLLLAKRVGIISDDKYNELKDNKGYAPFKRIIYDEVLGEVDPSEISGNLKLGSREISSLKKRTGSTKEIIYPLQGAMRNHMEFLNKCISQDAINTFLTEKTIEMHSANIKQVEWHKGIENQKDIMIKMEDGVRKAYAVDPMIKELISGYLSPRQVDLLERVQQSYKQLFTIGTTGTYFQFVFTNLPRDAFNYITQTYQSSSIKAVYNLFADTAKVIFGKGDDNNLELQYFQKYLALGGREMTFVKYMEGDYDAFTSFLRREEKGLKKVLNTLGKGVKVGLDILSMPSQLSEMWYRSVEFIEAKKNGDSDVVALEKARRVTTPFHHRGSFKYKDSKGNIVKAPPIPKYAPFQNAALQAFAWAGGNFVKDPKIRSRMIFMIALTTALGLEELFRAWRNADDDDKEQFKDLSAEDLGRFIHIPKKGGGIRRIAVSEWAGSIAGTINMAVMDFILDDVDYNATDYATALTTLVPDQFNMLVPVIKLLEKGTWDEFGKWGTSLLPALANPIIAIMGYKTYPEFAPLENDWQKSKLPADRYNEGTSKFAKWAMSLELPFDKGRLGDFLNLSPLQLDAILTQSFGRTIGMITGKPDAWNVLKSVNREYYLEYGRRLNDYWDAKEKNDQLYNSMTKGTRRYSKEKELEVFRRKALSKDIDKALDEYRSAYDSKDIAKIESTRARVIDLVTRYNENPSTPEMEMYLANPNAKTMEEAMRARALREISMKDPRDYTKDELEEAKKLAKEFRQEALLARSSYSYSELLFGITKNDDKVVKIKEVTEGKSEAEVKKYLASLKYAGMISNDVIIKLYNAGVIDYELGKWAYDLESNRNF